MPSKAQAFIRDAINKVEKIFDKFRFPLPEDKQLDEFNCEGAPENINQALK
jgi:hypothetical protein